ncbi:hypothetical protein LXL04_034146 [Taraxacum kok-saghyz]
MCFLLCRRVGIWVPMEERTKEKKMSSSSGRQVKAMLRKNWLLKIRHPYITLAEMMWRLMFRFVAFQKKVGTAKRRQSKDSKKKTKKDQNAPIRAEDMYFIGERVIDISAIGVPVRNAVPVKKGLFDHFSEIFQQETKNDWCQDASEIKKTHEIKNAIWTCGGNKSPGPDRFTIEFFKKFWDIIKLDLLKCFINLIPKSFNPSEFNHFRPISLNGLTYKVVSKVLGNRLKSVLPSIISDVQSAFVKNRKILDGPLVLNEIINWAKHKKRSFCFQN